MNNEKQSYYKNNRLKQMRAFCEVVRTGSVTLAAQHLFLSQPSVTLQIQALERELEVTLFERRGPVLKLTPDGEALYTLAEPLVKGIDGLEENFAAQHGKLESGEASPVTMYRLWDISAPPVCWIRFRVEATGGFVL